jgi:hypothetical protein
MIAPLTAVLDQRRAQPRWFPAPAVKHNRASLHSWAHVPAWLATAKLDEVDHLAVETAQACVLIDTALTVRQGLRELSKHDPPLVAGLVA